MIKNSKKTPYQVYVVRARRSVDKGLKGPKYNPQNPVETKQTKKNQPTVGVIILWDWGGGVRIPDSLGSCINVLMEHLDSEKLVSTTTEKVDSVCSM